MESVNRVILVGNLGRVARGLLDRGGQRAFDGYADALRHFLDDLAKSFAVAARRLAEALRQLRELATPLSVPKTLSYPGIPLFDRSAAFFHAAKVDGRNLP